MDIFAVKAECQLIHYGFADQGGPCVQKHLHRWRGRSRCFMCSQPIRIARACDMAFNVDIIFCGKCEPSERAGCRPWNPDILVFDKRAERIVHWHLPYVR